MAGNLSGRTSATIAIVAVAVIAGAIIGYAVSGRGSDDRVMASLPDTAPASPALPGTPPVTSPSGLPNAVVPNAGLTDTQRTAFLDGFMKQGKESCLEQARVAAHGQLADDKIVTYCDCTMGQMKSLMTDDEIQAVMAKGMEEMTAFTGRNLSTIVRSCAPS